jgi:hypothetical protein
MVPRQYPRQLLTHIQYMEPEPSSKVPSKVGSKAYWKPALDPDLEADLDPDLEAGLDPGWEAALEPALNAALDPDLNAALDPDLNAALDPDLKHL